jgi:hypothetical protein
MLLMAFHIPTGLLAGSSWALLVLASWSLKPLAELMQEEQAERLAWCEILYHYHYYPLDSAPRAGYIDHHTFPSLLLASIPKGLALWLHHLLCPPQPLFGNHFAKPHQLRFCFPSHCPLQSRSLS